MFSGISNLKNVLNVYVKKHKTMGLFTFYIQIVTTSNCSQCESSTNFSRLRKKEDKLVSLHLK